MSYSVENDIVRLSFSSVDSKQIGKWEHEGTFRARSKCKEDLSVQLCACGTLYVLVWGHYHVVPPHYAVG